MPDSDDLHEVPAWVPSTCEVIEVTAPRTVRLRALSTQVIFEDVPANSRVTLEWRQGTNISVEGRNIEGGARISLMGHGRQRKVAATVVGFPEVELEDVWHPQSRVQSDAASWILVASSVQLMRPGGIESAALKFLVKDGDGDVDIRLARGQARIEKVESRTSGATNVRIEAAAGAEISTAGPLVIGDFPLKRVSVQASSLTVGGPVEGGTFDVVSAALFTQAVSGHDAGRAVIRGDDIRLESALTDATVTGTTIHVDGKVTRCYLEAAREINVGSQVVDSDARVLSDGHICVGPRKAVELPAASADSNSLEHSRRILAEPAENPGSLVGSSVMSEGETHIASGVIQDCSIETKGDVLAIVSLSQGIGRSVKARRLAAGQLTINDANDVTVQQLICDADLSLAGRLETPVIIIGGTLARASEASSRAHATLDAASCFLMGEVDDVRIEADQARIVGELKSTAKLVVRKRAEVSANEAALEFLGTGSKSCELSGSLKDLVVPSGSEVSLNFLSSDTVVAFGHVKGQLTVQSPSWESLALRVEDRLAAHILASDVDSSVFILEPGSSLRCREGSRSLAVEVRDSGSIAVASTGKERVAANIRSACDDVETAPSTTVSGGVDLSLAGLIRTVEFIPTKLTPRLSLSDKSANVTKAFGSVLFGSCIAGRLHGIRPTGESPEALRIVGIELQQDDSSSGVVLDVDVTQVPFEQLTRLNDIGIVDPTRESMIAFASSPPRASETTAKRAELRSRSEQATRLVNVVGAKAIPGSSLAACNWAAARLHHRSLPRGTEKVVRYAHWAVGYSQRPLYSLACLLGTVGIAAGARLWKWRIDGMVIGWSELGDALMSTILLPLSVIRFASEVDQLYYNRFFNLLAFTTLALTFIFFVISVRNYMRTPGEK